MRAAGMRRAPQQTPALPHVLHPRRTPCAMRRPSRNTRRTLRAVQPCTMQPGAVCHTPCSRAVHAMRHAPCSRTPEFWPRNRVLARPEAIFALFHRAERDGHGKTPGRRFSLEMHAISFAPKLRLVSKNERIFRTRIDSAPFAEGPAPEGSATVRCSLGRGRTDQRPA